MSSLDKVDSEETDKPINFESEALDRPIRNAEYYFAFIIFLVENELFKVPLRNFVIGSEVFADMFQLPAPTDGPPPEGSSDDRPIRLDGIKKSDFIQLLRVMFPSHLDYSQQSNILSSEQWISVLNLSTMWLFQNIRGRAIKALGLPFIDIQDLKMKYGEITVDLYRDRIQLKREFPPPLMLDLIRRKIGQDEDMYLAAISIFTSSKDEAAEMVDLGLVTQPQYNSLLRYRDECRVRAVAVARPPHYHFTWMSPNYNWFNTDEEHDCNRGGNIFIANVQGKSMMRFWWREYMYEAEKRLAKRPWGTTVRSGDFFDEALLEGSKCSVCKQNLDQYFRQFAGVFAREIEEAVSQVDFEKL